jgi:Transposase IS116/IS110/IS902 family
LHLVCTLQVMVDRIRELETEIAQALRALPDGEIFRSFFHTPDAVICAATLLGEIGDSRARYSYRDAIAADAGQAPVAVESGKRKHASHDPYPSGLRPDVLASHRIAASAVAHTARGSKRPIADHARG